VQCMRAGAHVYVTYGSHELEELAVSGISPEDAGLLDLSHELAQKRLRRKMETVYEKVFAGVISTEQKVMLGAHFDRLQRLAGRTKRLFAGRR
jgi:hypothetical protein